MKGSLKKTLSLMLTLCMVISLFPTAVWAEADCTHQHDISCGYVAAEAEKPCNHAHTADCYAEKKECVHEHGEDCYVSNLICENAEEGHEHSEECYVEELICGHECSAETGCVTEVLNCRHEHDADCGYAPAVAGSPCTHEHNADCGGLVTEERPAAPADGMMLMSEEDPLPKVTLDINNGPITITEDGYTQGDGEEIPYTGNYILTGTYELNGTADATSNQVKIFAGNSSIQVTLKNLVIKHHSGNNSTEYAIGVYSPVQVLSGTVHLELEGNSTLIADGHNSGLFIAKDATAVIQGEGSLTCYGGHRAAGIGACNVANGDAGFLIVKSGNITAQSGNEAAGMGASSGCPMDSITIEGGYVDANGGAYSYSIGKGRSKGLGNLSITGGTLKCALILNGGSNTGSTVGVNGDTVSITGGNVGSYYNGEIEGRTKTTLYFTNDNGEILADTEVVVTEDEHTWKAKTDANGKIITYLNENTTSILASVDGSEPTESYDVTDSNVLIGNCVCKENGGNTITISGIPGDGNVKVYNDAGRDVSLVASYNASPECKMPIHPDYQNITYAIESIATGNGTPVSGEDYENYVNLNPTDMGATLSLQYKQGKAYTIIIKVTVGQGETQISETAAITANCTVSSEKSLDISKGNITVTEDSTGGVTYTQGETVVTCSAADRMIIAGTSDTNRLIVESGSPTIVFDDVEMSNGTASPIELKGGSTTLWLEGENKITNITNPPVTADSPNNANGYAILIQAGAKLTINSEEDEQNGTALDVFGEDFSFAEKMDTEGVNEPTPVKYKGTLIVSGRGGIGTWTVDKEGTEINIYGGNIDVTKTNAGYGYFHSAIGTSVKSDGTVSHSAKYTINITGGNVKAVVDSDVGVGIGGQNANVTITGGCVSAEEKKGSTSATRGAAIGMFDCSITIGTADSAESTPYIRAIGKGCYAGIGGGRSDVTINSGTVYSAAEGNSSAIGGNFAQPFGKIAINGGTVRAFNTEVQFGASIGVRASTAQYSGNQPLPVEISITGGTVVATGILGGGPYVEGKDYSSVTISGNDTVVTVESGATRGDVKVEDGGSLATHYNGVFGNDGTIIGSLSVSDGSHATINGSVEKGLTVLGNAEASVSNQVIGSVRVSDGGEADVGMVTGDVNVDNATVIVGGDILGDMNVTNGGAFYGDIKSIYGDYNAASGNVSPVHRVEFNNEGSLVKYVMRSTGGTAIGSEEFPITPKRDGYEFTGWNTRYDGSGSAITADTVVNGIITAYAQWKEIPGKEAVIAKGILSGEVFVVMGESLSEEQVPGLQSAVESLLKGSSFEKAGGTATVAFDPRSHKFITTLTLGEQNETTTLVHILVEETLTSDTDKAVFALKDVKNTTVRIPNGTSDSDLIQKSYDALKKFTLPYENQETSISIIHIWGIRYRVTAIVGDESYERDVVVRPEYYSDSNGNTSGSSSSSSKKYPITIEKAENGTIITNRTSASKGSTITITVKAEDGFVIDKLTITDKNGNKIDLKDKGNGVYTFTMPASKVEVEATFSKGETPVVEEVKAIILKINEKMASVFGQPVENDVAPVIRNDRTMLPIRFVAEALGGSVAWNSELQKVTITKDELVIEIYINQPFALVNGTPVQLDAPAFIENSRTYLPLRFVAENLGATVTWNAETQEVTIVPNK